MQGRGQLNIDKMIIHDNNQTLGNFIGGGGVE